MNAGNLNCGLARLGRLMAVLWLVLWSAVVIAAGPGYEVREIRSGVYWLSDGAYNTIFLVSPRGVIAVDPLPTLGARYLEAVRSVTDQPVTHVIYSHAHADHIGGASFMPRGAVIIAQRDTADLLHTRADPRRPEPTVVFDHDYTLTVGGQTLVLSDKGTNHSAGNLFIYAPAQKVLMLVDVVYPGYMPYPHLGIAVDVDGYELAHRQALAYDFTDFIGGHVDRPGTRADVQASLDFVRDLRAQAVASLAEESFPAYLQRTAGRGLQTWFAHDDYEQERVEACLRRMVEPWGDRLKGADRFLRSHCWTMIVALVIDVQARDGVIVNAKAAYAAEAN